MRFPKIFGIKDNKPTPQQPLSPKLEKIRQHAVGIWASWDVYEFYDEKLSDFNQVVEATPELKNIQNPNFLVVGCAQGIDIYALNKLFFDAQFTGLDPFIEIDPRLLEESENNLGSKLKYYKLLLSDYLKNFPGQKHNVVVFPNIPTTELDEEDTMSNFLNTLEDNGLVVFLGDYIIGDDDTNLADHQSMMSNQFEVVTPRSQLQKHGFYEVWRKKTS